MCESDWQFLIILFIWKLKPYRYNVVLFLHLSLIISVTCLGNLFIFKLLLGYAWHSKIWQDTIKLSIWTAFFILCSQQVIAEGGHEKIFQQTFNVSSEEQLRKAYACYLSTSAGPVMGILYISTAKIAFCSDSPLSYKVGDKTEWTYYKVGIIHT